MTRRTFLGLALLATALLACAGSAWASSSRAPAHAVAAAKKKSKSKAPVITKMTPLKLKVGEKLYISGKNFVAGKGKTKVFFLRVGHEGAAWVRADKATKTKITVTVPANLQKLLPASGTARFQIRVLTSRFGSVSKTNRSPLITGTPGGDGAGGAGVVGPGGGVGGCTPNLSDATVDSDHDLIPDVREHQIGTDPCNKDSDGDGVEDGYEYYSALDLNSNALPYPAKRPYPNALNPDADTDYDGDGLTLADEFTLWIAYGNHALPLNYSDGKQTTVPQAAPPCNTTLGWSLDFNCDGQLDDGERDADNDGLSNWVESHGPLSGQEWWTAQKAFKDEKAYPVTFAGTSMMDPDTDGDGVPDGLDDQDHDGYNNEFESDRPGLWKDTYVSLSHNWTAPGTLTNPTAGGNTPDPYARVNPFNPCKPLWSSICHVHPPAGYYGDNDDWAAPTQAQVIAAGASAPGQIP